MALEPGSDPGDGEDTSAGELEPPVIDDPIDEVVVSATDREDITLEVSNLGPGARIEIDGSSWSLVELGPAVREGEIVRIPLAGSMVVGDHELVFTQGLAAADLRSEPLVVRIEPAELKPLLVSLAPAPVGIGDGLIVGATGEQLLALVDAEAQTLELRLGAWSTLGVSEPLAGLAWPSGPVAGAIDVAIVEHDQARAVITTWLADGGTRVFARIHPLDADNQLGTTPAPIELWDLNDPDHRALLGPHQLASNHAVALLDRMLVIGVEARRDAEAPSPGDRRLVTRWLDSDGGLGSPQLLRGPGDRDLDLPHRAQLWLDRGVASPSLSVRLGLAFPWLLELAGNGLPSLSGDPGELAAAPGSVVWMVSADGALGSRQVFALELGPGPEQATIRALRIDRWGAPDLVEASAVELVELPARPTAAPSLSSIKGAPVLLIPFGDAAPAWAMRSTGDAVVLDEFAQLDCDAYALAQPLADAEGSERVFACLDDRELRIGALGVK